MYSAFCQKIQSTAAYYYGIRKIVTVISLHLRVLLAKCTPHQHLDCNISHDRYLPDTLRSTKQFRLSILHFFDLCTVYTQHWKPRVNHLTHLSHYVSLYGQKYSFFTHVWVILSVYWPTMAQMSQMRKNSGFSVKDSISLAVK